MPKDFFKIIVERTSDVFPKHEGKYFFVADDLSDYCAQKKKAETYANTLGNKPNTLEVTIRDIDNIVSSVPVSRESFGYTS